MASSKKGITEDPNNKPLKGVRFAANKDEREHIKPETILKTEQFLSTLTKEEDKICRFKTLEEVSEYTDQLMQELNDYDRKKKEGIHDKMWLKEQYNNLQYKFELLNQVKERIENECKNKELFDENVASNNHSSYASGGRKLQEKNTISHQENKSKDVKPNDNSHLTLKERIYYYLQEINSHCDVVIVLHCCVLKFSIDEFLKRIKDILYSNEKIRISICHFKTSKEVLINKEFYNKDNYKSITADVIKRENFNDIRNEFISLNWNKKSIRIVCNVMTSNCVHQKLTDHKNLETRDPVEDFLRYNRIKTFTFVINNRKESAINDRAVSFISHFEEFFQKDVFKIMLIHITTQSLMEQVYVLKRNSFNTFEEFKKYFKSIHILKVEHDDLQSNFIGLKYKLKIPFNSENIFKTSSLDYTDLIIGTNQKHIKLIKSRQIFSYTNFLHEAEVRKSNIGFANESYGIWLEKLSSKEVQLSVLDTHLTAAYFAKQFNEKLHNEYICVPEAFLLKVESDVFMSQKIKYSLENSSLKLNIGSNDLLQAFIHFTYNMTDGKIIIFDLRPIITNQQAILLTEPIILSSYENRFGMSNLGNKILNEIFVCHRCNSFCKMLENRTEARNSSPRQPDVSFSDLINCFLS